MSAQKGHEIPTIDVVLVTVVPSGSGGTEIAIDTASKIEVTPQIETKDAIKLIVKGKLLSQKPVNNVLTGNAITLTDNVFVPELVKLFQGGTIKYWGEEGHTSKVDTDKGYGIASYTPPTAGSGLKGKPFTLNAYSAIYSAAGLITGYEKISYPNCQGVPVALSAEDDVFRVNSYTINSAPAETESPYSIEYIGPDDLPAASSLPAPGGA